MKTNIKLDIQGKRFGALTALQPVHVETGKKKVTFIGAEIIKEHKCTEVFWECKCDCGKVIRVKRQNLLSGNTKSCGCKKAKVNDRTGQRYNHVVVLERDYERQKEMYSTAAHWKCRCDCGTIFTVSSTNIKRIKSCGCIHTSGQRFKYNLSGMEGQRFGSVVVLERDLETQFSKKSIRAHWKCKCDCGETIILTTQQLKTNKYPHCRR